MPQLQCRDHADSLGMHRLPGFFRGRLCMEAVDKRRRRFAPGNSSGQNSRSDWDWFAGCNLLSGGLLGSACQHGRNVWLYVQDVLAGSLHRAFLHSNLLAAGHHGVGTASALQGHGSDSAQVQKYQVVRFWDNLGPPLLCSTSSCRNSAWRWCGLCRRKLCSIYLVPCTRIISRCSHAPKLWIRQGSEIVSLPGLYVPNWMLWGYLLWTLSSTEFGQKRTLVVSF